MPREGGRLVEWDHVVSRLRAATVYWIATVTPGGRPHVVPVWGALVAGQLYLETGDPDTIKNRNLAANGEVVVHLDGADDVVIVRGTAAVCRPRGAVADAIRAAMYAKYPDYSPVPGNWDVGGLVMVQPRTLLAWQDMPSATRWRFGVEQ